MSVTLLILALVAAAATVVLSFLSVRWSSALALAALFLAFFGMPPASRVTAELVTWAVAAGVSLGLCYMLPASEARSRRGVGYLAAGALVGGIVVYLVNIHYVVIGTVAGALLAALAYSRTPQGRPLVFPSEAWIQFVAAKGLPVMVNVSVACITVFQSCFTLVNAG